MDRICVFVLGDCGHSPRMQYHTLSLANEGSQVEFLGLSGSECHKPLRDHPNIRITRIPEWWSIIPRIKALFFILGPIKVLCQMLTILYYLCFKVEAYRALFVQTPPAIPTLIIAPIASWWRGATYVIDWHNFGYSLTNSSLLKPIAYHIERFAARLGHHHICVSKHMKDWLKDTWGITATVMYDRPPHLFQKLSMTQKHELFQKLKLVGDKEEGTLFTTIKHGKVVYKPNRPVLLVSSTSWTIDEDFSILLEGLKRYDERVEKESLPSIHCIITGKGPLKQYYLDCIKAIEWKAVVIETAWLEAGDYPKLLAAADLGISLHTSSSGLDLPMKIVDMFGVGLPVLAVQFKTLSELVKRNKNGRIFSTINELTLQLVDLLHGFPENKHTLDAFSDHLDTNFRMHRWDDEWKQKTKNIFY